MKIRAVIDIEEDAVEPAARRLRVEPVVTPRQGKEIGFDETASRVVRQTPAKGQDAGLVPSDQRRQIFDHGQRPRRL